MEEHGVPVRRIINGGGIPQKNAVLNQVYANVMGKPILVPKGDVTSLGSAIFAFLAAGAFPTIEAGAGQAVSRLRHRRTGTRGRRDLSGVVRALPQAVFRLRPAGTGRLEM